MRTSDQNIQAVYHALRRARVPGVTTAMANEVIAQLMIGGLILVTAERIAVLEGIMAKRRNLWRAFDPEEGE